MFIVRDTKAATDRCDWHEGNEWVSKGSGTQYWSREEADIAEALVGNEHTKVMELK